jgi:molybdate-binding protein
MANGKEKKKKEEKKSKLSGAFIVAYEQDDIYLLLAMAEKLGCGFSELNDEECRLLLKPEKEEKAAKKEKKEKKAKATTKKA